MLHRTQRVPALMLATVVLAGCSDSGGLATESGRSARAELSPTAQFDQRTLKDKGDVQIVAASGDITAAVTQYRDLLGGGLPNPNVPGEQPGGRREINWDGVPAGFTNNDLFPGNFFNVNSPRGVVFTTDSVFRISSNGYTDVNPAYAGEFNFFSPIKLFASRGSTVVDVQFFVAGSTTPATVVGFGSVFEDVGREYSTTIEYFDADGTRILRLMVPRRSDEKGLSFAGAVFDSRIVARVRITAGDTSIDPTVEDNVKGAGPKRDIVVMDDFIYGEPRASSSQR